MSYCKKEICSKDIVDMSDDDLGFTLDRCERSCNKYYRCDTVALIQDRLQELREE